MVSHETMVPDTLGGEGLAFPKFLRDDQSVVCAKYNVNQHDCDVDGHCRRKHQWQQLRPVLCDHTARWIRSLLIQHDVYIYIIERRGETEGIE
jgi:hypothetical protein